MSDESKPSPEYQAKVAAARPEFAPYLSQDEQDRGAVAGQSHFAAHRQVRGMVYRNAVRWQGPWHNPTDSLSIAGRRTIEALCSAGIPVALKRPFNPVSALDSDFHPVCKPFFPLMQTEFERLALTIVHGLCFADDIHRVLYPGNSFQEEPELVERLHKQMIYMTVFERDRLPDMTLKNLRRFGQVWVPCFRNWLYLQNQGINARFVPHPIDRKSFASFRAAAKRKAVKAAFSPQRPVDILNVGKWEPRKNHHGLIGGFLKAFVPSDPVRLIIKSSPYGTYKDYPGDLSASLAVWCNTDEVADRGWNMNRAIKAVRLISGAIPEDALSKLFENAHVYATASHGEGFDMPALDAVVAGCRIVHVGFGGSEDFASHKYRCWPPVWDHDESGNLSGDASYEPTDPFYRWKGTRWAKVDVNRVADALKLAVQDTIDGAPIPNSFRDETDAKQPWGMYPVTTEELGQQLRIYLDEAAKDAGVQDLSWETR